MYYNDYIIFLVAILICALFSIIASLKVNSAFKKYNLVPNRSGMTGYDTAKRLMELNNIQGISIGKVSGSLSDHYHPTKRVVNLSDDTYNHSSVAAVAVAAHEMGHVMQKKTGYLFYQIRTALVPVVNIGSFLAFPLVIIGIILDILSITYNNTYVGFYVAMVGVVLYGGSTIFALITLPVELNASKRAKQMLVSSGILAEDELPGASQVLSAAALTYIASLLTSIVYFLRFFVRVLTIFGRRNND